MRRRTTALIAIPLIAAFALAGCSTSPNGGGGGTASPSGETSEPSSPDAPAAGELADPGTTVGLDTYLTYEFTTTEDGTALISAKLDSIEPATDDEVAFLTDNFGDQLDGFDIYLLRMTEKKESGDPVKFNADYSGFSPVDASGARVQDVTLIGWDGCRTQSFSEEFDTVGTEAAQCYIAAVPTGGKPPAGMAYTGGYDDNNPYDYLDGKPLLFLK